MRVVFPAILAAIIWLGSGTAHAAQLCAMTDVTYSDNGYGEDYWTTDGAKYMPGVRIRARHFNNCDFSGSSGFQTAYDGYANSSGCATFSTSDYDSCWQLTVWSYGYPAGNNLLRGRNANGNTEYWYINGANLSQGQAWLTYPGLASFKVYATLAASISWFRGGLTSTTLNAQASDDNCTCTNNGSSLNVGSRHCVAGGQGYICLDDDDGDVDRKFLMAHEYGHHSLWFTAGSWNSGSSCGGHGMTTQEEQACAMMEGWANFVSAGVWNSYHTNANGYLRYWGDCRGSWTINVESTGSDPDCKVKYMENNFFWSSWPGRSTEMDWMRTYWDFFTNSLSGEPGTRPSHNQMQDDFVGFLPTSASQAKRAYDLYRLGVAANSNCSQYNRLVYMAAANGTDHCEDEFNGDPCDNVPGCVDVD